MATRTVTFSVQLGSGGYAIARAVAAKLQYQYIDSEITSQAATEAGVEPSALAAHEQSRPAINRIIDRLFTASLYTPDVTYVGIPEADLMSSAIDSLGSGGYRLFVENVVRRMALRGAAVIVGHASQVILQDDPDVLKVLICGSPAQRTRRLAGEEKLKPSDAGDRIRKSDRERKAFFKQAYGVDLLDPQLYDLSFNTDNLEADIIVGGVASFILGLSRQEEVVATPRAAAAPVRISATKRGIPKTRQEDALHRAMAALTQSATTDEGDDKEWAGQLSNNLAALMRVFNRHTRDAESTNGSLNEIIGLKPQLSRRVANVTAEHETIRQEIDEFAAEIGQQTRDGAVNREVLRSLVTRLSVSLRNHEAKGADLLYEAFTRDEGTGG